MPPPGFSLEERPLTWVAFSLLVGLLALICFAGLADLPFDTDDRQHLQDSVTLDQSWTHLFSPDLELPGRPAVQLLFWGGRHLWGERPAPFHLLSVLLHALAAILLARLCRALGHDLDLSLLAGLLFLTGVVPFRAVHWISAIAYPLALDFALAGLLFLRRYLEDFNRVWLVGLYPAFLLATMSHPAAAVLWFFCLYLAWQRVDAFRRPLLDLAPLGLLLGSAIAAAIYQYPRVAQVEQLIRKVDFVYLIGHFFTLWGRLFLNARLLLRPVDDFATWEMAVGGLLLCGALYIVARRAQPLDIWAAWCLIATQPFINSTEFAYSRYLYLASAGSAVVLAWGLKEIARRLSSLLSLKTGLLLALLSLLLLASGTLSLRRLQAYSFYSSARHHVVIGQTGIAIELIQRALDTAPQTLPLAKAYVYLISNAMSLGRPFEPLLDRALQQLPQSPELHAIQGVTEAVLGDSTKRSQGRKKVALALRQIPSWRTDFDDALAGLCHNLGRGLYMKEEFAPAIDAFRLALEISPRRLQTTKGLINALSGAGRYPEAIETAREAVTRYPEDPTLYFTLGNQYYLDARYSEAVAAYRQVLARDPDHLRSLANLAAALGELGRDAETEQVYLQALAISGATAGPDQRRIWLELGRLYRETGRPQQALALYRRFLATDLSGAGFETFLTLGQEFYLLEARDEAEAAYRQVLRLDPDEPTAHTNLGWLLYLRGRHAEALEQFRAVLVRQPLPNAQFNLGLTYLAMGQIDSARAAYARGVERFGAEMAERIGAVAQLKKMAATGEFSGAARQILATHWR